MKGKKYNNFRTFKWYRVEIIKTKIKSSVEKFVLKFSYDRYFKIKSSTDIKLSLNNT